MTQEHINKHIDHDAKEVTPEEQESSFGIMTPSEMKTIMQPLHERVLRSLRDRATNEANTCISKLFSELRKGKTSASLVVSSKENIKDEVVRLIIAAFATAGWYVTYSPFNSNIVVRYPGFKESKE